MILAPTAHLLPSAPLTRVLTNPPAPNSQALPSSFSSHFIPGYPFNDSPPPALLVSTGPSTAPRGPSLRTLDRQRALGR